MSDKSKVIKVDTYKSGPFAFSANYDEEKLSDQLVKARVLYRTVADIPILPNLASRLEEELIKKSIFGTAAIEGNPLSQEQVDEVLSEEERKGKVERAEKQIRNLKTAYIMIKHFTPSPQPFLLQEKLIKDIHKVITEDCEGPENSPGQYRNKIVKVGNKDHGGIYTPPKILDDIKNLMTYFIDWINSPEILKENPAIRGALAHYYLALIHPFGNGNGRTARAIEAILLKSAGIKFVPHMLSNFYYRNIDDYFWVFSLSERNDDYSITPFLEFFLNGLISSLEEIQAKIFWWIREFTLRDYYAHLKRNKDITHRQFDLLILLLEYREKFSLKDLFEKDKFKVVYRKVSERTARRDLKILQERKLVSIDGKGDHSLNYYALE